MSAVRAVPARPPRNPAPYVTQRGDGRWLTGCGSCLVIVSGHPDEATAESWARHHRCPDDPGYRVENHGHWGQTRGERAA